jgi:ABC-type glycerol-3-phosphate transport system substrate-binding protein
MTQLFRMLALAAALAMAATACSGDNNAADRRPAVPGDQATAGRQLANTLTIYVRDRDIAEPL